MNMNLEKATSKYIGHRLWTKFFLALLPLVAIIAAGQNNPLLFMILWAAGHILGNLIFLKLKFKNAFRDELYKRIRVNFFKFKIKYRNESTGQSKNSSSLNIFRENSILARTQGVGVIFLVWSFLFINSVVAVVIFESWPLFHEVITRRKKKQDNEIESNKAFSRIFIFTVLGLVSLTLVLFSDISFSRDHIIILALLFFGATVFSLQGKFRPVQSRALSEISKKTEFKAKELQVTVYTRLFAACVTFVLGLLIFGIFEAFNLFQGFSGRIGLGGIILIVSVGFTSSLAKNWQREIQLKGRMDLRTKGIGYLTPVMGVGLFCSFIALDKVFNFNVSDLPSLADVKWSWFVIGFLGIFSANLLTILKSESKRLGVTSLIVALLLSGSLIFFRDNWSWWVNQIDSQKVGNLEYFGFVGIVATVFALLVGFETSRIQERTQKEEKLAFSLLRRLENLPSRNDGKKYEDLVKELDEATDSAKISKIYMSVLKEFPEKNSSVSEENIREMKVELDSLSHSKQYGRTVGETIAIILLGIFITGLSISFRPTGVFGLSVILIDIFAFLFAATVVYLVFHQYELRAYRGNSIITKSKGGYFVKFQEATFKDEVAVATMLVFLVVVIFIAMFFLKWLVWM